MNLRETGCEDMNWIKMTQNRIQWGVFCDYGNEPLDFTTGKLTAERLLKEDTAAPRS
jgi:hypothetical protein